MNRRHLLGLTGSALASNPIIGTATAGSSDFVYPATGYISQPYYLNDPEKGNHPAVDIANETGTPLYAAHHGVASTHVQKNLCGEYVKIDHGSGYSTVYCHMSDWDVADGQQVTRMDKIGEIGTSGHTTGPHVHFKIKRYGDEVYIPATDGDHVHAGDGIPKEYPGIESGGGAGSGPPPTQPNYGTDEGRFQVDDHVRTTSGLNTRDSPDTDSNVIVTLSTGSPGQIVDGPVANEGYIWYEIEWAPKDIPGWSVQNYLEVDTSTDSGGNGGGGGSGGSNEFDMFQGVKVTADDGLNTRAEPGLDHTVVYTAPFGTHGKIIDGPEESDGYTWWGLYWPERDIHGWCVGAYLTDDPHDRMNHPSGARLSCGDTVEATADSGLNTRRSPGLQSDIKATMAEGSQAEVLQQGPQAANGYTWWFLDWDDPDIFGWSVQTHLDVVKDGSCGHPTNEGDSQVNQAEESWIWDKEHKAEIWKKVVATSVMIKDPVNLEEQTPWQTHGFPKPWSEEQMDQGVFKIPVHYSTYARAERGDKGSKEWDTDVTGTEMQLDLGEGTEMTYEGNGNLDLWGNGKGWLAAQPIGEASSHNTEERVTKAMMSLVGSVSRTVGWINSAIRGVEGLVSFIESDGKERINRGGWFADYDVVGDYVHGSREGQTTAKIMAHVPRNETVTLIFTIQNSFHDGSRTTREVAVDITPKGPDSVETSFEEREFTTRDPIS